MNPNIPREAVDAAARAICNDLGGEGAWDVMPGSVQHNYREAAAAALTAAAGHVIAAKLERLSDKYGQESKRKDEWAEVQDTHDRHHGEGESHAYSDVADELLAIATQLRGEVPA